MKTAVSIPDEVFEDAEKLAKKLQVSRSKFYSEAIVYYLRFHKKGGITGALNKVYGEKDSKLDEGLRKMQRKSVEKW